MMCDYEEDIDDFPILSTENSSEKAESLVGAYRAESTDQWTAATGITTKMPPLLNGWTSGFEMRLTVLEVSKRGPTLKNRLVGDGKCTRDSLTEILWHHPMESSISKIRWYSNSSKDLRLFSSRDFSYFYEQEEKNMEMVKWIVIKKSYSGY